MKKIRETFGIEKFSHDEGNVLFGADGLNLMTTTMCIQPYSLSYNAWNFKHDLDNGVERAATPRFFSSTILLSVSYRGRKFAALRDHSLNIRSSVLRNSEKCSGKLAEPFAWISNPSLTTARNSNISPSDTFFGCLP